MSGLRRGRDFLAQSWDTIALAILVIALLVATLPLGRVAGWIPRLVLCVTLVLLVFRLAADAARIFGTVADQSLAEPQSAVDSLATGMSPLLALAWIVVLLLAVWLLGVTTGAALYCFAYLRWCARASRVFSVTYALALGAGVQLIFSFLLQASLYQGWLPGAWPGL